VCCKNKLDGLDTDWTWINGGKKVKKNKVSDEKKIKRTFKNEVKKKEKKRIRTLRKPKERKIKFTVQGRTTKEF
jgi:hypothetical protein